jgi:hypothetical protein
MKILNCIDCEGFRSSFVESIGRKPYAPKKKSESSNNFWIWKPTPYEILMFHEMA